MDDDIRSQQFAAYMLNEKQQWELSPCFWTNKKLEHPSLPNINIVKFREGENVVLYHNNDDPKNAIVQGVMITFRFYENDTDWNVYYDLKWAANTANFHSHGYYRDYEIRRA